MDDYVNTDNLKPIPKKERYVRSRDDNNPLHTTPKYVPGATPTDVRIGLTLLPARYLLRGLFHTMTDASLPETVKESITHHFTKPFSERAVQKIDTLLNSSTYAEDIARIRNLPKDEMVRGLRKTESGRELYSSIKGHMQKVGAARNTNNLIEYALVHGNDGKKPSVTNQSRRGILQSVDTMGFNYGYDLSLGAASVYMSYMVSERAREDMMRLYSEVVSYETGKPLESITFDDIKHSSNRIIQSTNRNYQNKLKQRFGTDLLFFLRIPFRWMSASDLAIGAKGLMWFNDVWGRKPTMLESLNYFVNDKLNPEFGISDPIVMGDLINFYQQYMTKFSPEKAFRTLIANDPTDASIWAKSEPIFARMTELMNLTYNYKHVTELDDETGRPVASANFTLPKFVYLLGHDLISPKDPACTLMFVEIANLHGMDSVKEAEKMYYAGSDLKEIIAEYPVSLDALDNKPSKENLAESSKAVSVGMGGNLNDTALNKTDTLPHKEVTTHESHHEKLTVRETALGHA